MSRLFFRLASAVTRRSSSRCFRRRLWVGSTQSTITPSRDFLLFDPLELEHRVSERPDEMFSVGPAGETERPRASVVTMVFRAGKMDVQSPRQFSLRAAVELGQLPRTIASGRRKTVARALWHGARGGDVSRRAALAHDFLLTHRLILQLRFEINAVVHPLPQSRFGAGELVSASAEKFFARSRPTLACPSQNLRRDH